MTSSVRPLRLGVLGAADIAKRRFLPALQRCPSFELAGIASRSHERATELCSHFGGHTYDSYFSLLDDPQIDTVYIPLPPALHFDYALQALKKHKHVLLEKPATVTLEQAQQLCAVAEESGLTLYENYMFLCHPQLERIKEIISSGRLGELRLIRATFGFPRRAFGDFRYQKSLGGGALLDCGGYPLRLALELLAPQVQLADAALVPDKSAQSPQDAVDLYGNAVLRSSSGLAAQVAFGMDNAYQCSLEIWGSRATLKTSRIFTAPPELKITLSICDDKGEELIEVPPADQFLLSLERFAYAIGNPATNAELRNTILRQSTLVETCREKAGFIL